MPTPRPGWLPRRRSGSARRPGLAGTSLHPGRSLGRGVRHRPPQRARTAARGFQALRCLVRLALGARLGLEPGPQSDAIVSRILVSRGRIGVCRRNLGVDSVTAGRHRGDISDPYPAVCTVLWSPSSMPRRPGRCWRSSTRGRRSASARSSGARLGSPRSVAGWLAPAGTCWSPRPSPLTFWPGSPDRPRAACQSRWSRWGAITWRWLVAGNLP